MMSKVKVVIYGKEYVIKTEEPPSYIYGLARELERKISDISDKTGVSPYNAAIMAALSALDELCVAEESVDRVRDQIKLYVDEAGKARLERDAALKEIDILKAKIEKLEAKR